MLLAPSPLDFKSNSLKIDILDDTIILEIPNFLLNKNIQEPGHVFLRFF